MSRLPAPPPSIVVVLKVDAVGHQAQASEQFLASIKLASNKAICLKTRKRRKLSTFAVFVDFKKAYDTVTRSLLFRDLNDLGISTKFLNTINTIYSQVECAIKLNGNMTEWFNVNSGLKQGCVLSPVLFNIFINSLVTDIKALDIGIDIEGENWYSFVCR